MAGRPPKPTELHAIDGTKPRAKVVRLARQPGQRGVGEPPPDFTDEERAVWERFSDEWRAVLLHSDRAAFTLLCQAWAEMENARRRVLEDGSMILTPNGMLMKSPWVSLLENRREYLRKAMAQFGVTPTSRAKVLGDDAASGRSDRGEKYFT